MVNTRTYVRLLRHLGITLIFAPEPFTTPFGVAFILAARYLSRKLEASREERLREMVHYYVDHSSISRDGAHGDAPGPVKRHGLKEEHPILGQITGSRNFETNPSVSKGRQGTREGTGKRTTDTQSLSRRYKYGDGLSDASARTQKVIHHTIDIGWLPQRYEGANTAVAHSSWATTSGGAEGVTYHSVNMGLLSQHYGTGSIGHAKAKPRSINMAQLRQHYGSAANCTTVHRALQNNNYYYGILSRKNVIGGY